LLAPAAVAVAAGLMLLRLHFEPPAVPAYTLPPAAAAAVTSLARGGSFSLDLRPEAPVVGAVAARGFLLQDGKVTPWDAPFSVDVDGAVHIAGPVDVLFKGVPPGVWEAAVAVGRPEMLPTAPRDVLRARDGTSPATWHLVWERVQLGP
jgi:hypothetical protein